MCVEGLLAAFVFGRLVNFLGLVLEGFSTQVASRRIVEAVVDVKAGAGDMMLDIFIVVFNGLHAEEDTAQKQGKNEEGGDQLFLSNLCGPHRHGHGQAAADQNHGVEAAELQIQRAAGVGEDQGVGVTVDGVGEEEAAKEKDFGGQKDPHAESSGLLLLFERLKLPR